MVQDFALTRRIPLFSQQVDLLRLLVVYGCALVLILARTTLPF